MCCTFLKAYIDRMSFSLAVGTLNITDLEHGPRSVVTTILFYRFRIRKNRYATIQKQICKQYALYLTYRISYVLWLADSLKIRVDDKYHVRYVSMVELREVR